MAAAQESGAVWNADGSIPDTVQWMKCHVKVALSFSLITKEEGRSEGHELTRFATNCPPTLSSDNL